MLTALVVAVLIPNKFVVVDSLLIGYLDGKTWKDIPEKSKSSETFKLQGLGMMSAAGSLTIRGYEENEAVGGIFLKTTSFPRGVYHNGLKPSWPRKITKLSNTSKAYLSALGAWLKSKGVASAASLSAAYSVDLDGDGKQEVLLQAASKGFSTQSTADPKKTDYSALLMRKVGSNGSVTTTVLAEALTPLNGMTHNTFRSIVDLDGDGKYEVIASMDYYEGQEGAIFGFKNGSFQRLCGAGAGL